MNVHSLFDVSYDSLWFPVDNGKTFRADWVSYTATMMGDGALRCSLSLSPKVLLDSPYVFLRVVYMWAFEFVDYPTPL